MEIDLTKFTPDVRKLNDMKNVLYDQGWLKTGPEGRPDFNLYYMYRGIEEKNDIRYDITIIPHAMLGSEFVKTKGHYHIGAYQEVYTVLEGEAIYLMQKKNNKEEVEDAYAVRAQKGDFVIIPSFYGHITINPSEGEELKMANWVSPRCKSDYSLYEKMQGACYYYTKQGWVKNNNYKPVPELRFEEPLKSLPEDLSFLK